MRSQYSYRAGDWLRAASLWCCGLFPEFCVIVSPFQCLAILPRARPMAAAMYFVGGFRAKLRTQGFLSKSAAFCVSHSLWWVVNLKFKAASCTLFLMHHNTIIQMNHSGRWKAAASLTTTFQRSRQLTRTIWQSQLSKSKKINYPQSQNQTQAGPEHNSRYFDDVSMLMNWKPEPIPSFLWRRAWLGSLC